MKIKRSYTAKILSRVMYSVVPLLLSGSSASGQQAFFMGLGDLPGGDYYSGAADVSGDGRVVVGTSRVGPNTTKDYSAFRWTRESGMIRLGTSDVATTAARISGDGKTIVGGIGSSAESSPFNGPAYRWQEDTGMIRLPTAATDVTGVSRDGSSISFIRHTWSEAGGLVGSPNGMRIADISEDGTALVGWEHDDGFIWTNQGSTVLGPPLGDGTRFFNPARFSADGNAVVGHGGPGLLWTRDGGLTLLGTLPDGATAGAVDVSADASVIVGGRIPSRDWGAWIWRESRTVELLRDVLANEYGLGAQVAEWSLGTASAMSNDGRTIVGTGINPNGQNEGWIAFLGTPVPEPSTTLLAAMAFLPLTTRRRRVQNHAGLSAAKVRFAVLAIALVAVVTSEPARAAQLFELHANDAAPLDYFGRSVAIDENRVIIGAPEADKSNDIYNSGAAYLFDVKTGQLLHKLVASNAGKAHNFGTAVAIHGDRALVGAERSNEDQAQYSGSAYLFDTTTGLQLRELVADGPAFLGFGRSVALTDNFAVVGSGADQVGSTPEAYVFDTTTGSQLRILTAFDVVPNDRFATAIAIEGNLALVGAWGKDNDAGAAYLFDLSTGQQLYKLTAADAASNIRFGRSLAMSGNLALIGAEGGNNGQGAAYVFDVTTGQQLQRLTADDGNRIGSSVALSGNLALIGDHDNGYTGVVHGPGAAYVFDALTGQQLAKLTASDGASNDGFGYSVAIDGTSVLVGALATDDAGDRSGSAYLFDVTVPEPSACLLALLSLLPLTWRRRGVQDRAGAARSIALLVLLLAAPVRAEELYKLTPSDGMSSDYFGHSAAMNGNIGLVGAPGAFIPPGSAYLFDVITGQQLFVLDASDGGHIGESVALSANYALVGARLTGESVPSSGSAYLFDVSTGQQLRKLNATDAAQDDQFGLSVALSGNTALVGANWDDDAGNKSGSAYLFDVTTGQQLRKLTAADAASRDNFGIAVALSDGNALVGASDIEKSSNRPGSAYLINVNTGQQLFKLLASDASVYDGFGMSVALSGNIALVGAHENDHAGSSSGAAYLFDVTSGQQLFKLTATDASANDHFGWSVALSGNFALIGSYRDDDAGETSGSAYLFDVITGQQIAKLTASDALAGDQFGRAVALDGSLALIGASYNNNGAGSESGSAYVFRLDTIPEPSTALLAALSVTTLTWRRRAIGIQANNSAASRVER